MKLVCECGHPQVLHMGPTGPCRVKTPLVAQEGFGFHVEACKCAGFRLIAPELKRSDLA